MANILAFCAALVLITDMTAQGVDYCLFNFDNKAVLKRNKAVLDSGGLRYCRLDITGLLPAGGHSAKVKFITVDGRSSPYSLPHHFVVK